MYGITPKANIDILDKAPPENMLNMSSILPRCCSNKNCITEGSIPGKVMKLPNLNIISANITKKTLCLSSFDLVKPPILVVVLLLNLDIVIYQYAP